MGYSQSYGMSGTAVPEWRQGLEKCKQTMSCTKGRCMAYDDVGKRCTCVKCDSELINRPYSGITPSYDSNDTRPGRYTTGMRGINDEIPSRYYEGSKPCFRGYERRCIGDRCSCYPIDKKFFRDRFMTEYGVKAGFHGLGESFLESVGSIANLAIIGLAIYGGFCLAKKL